MKKLLLSTTAAFVICIQVRAQTVNTAGLDSLFDILYAKNKSMASVAIARNGKVLYAKATGLAAQSPAPVPSTVHTRYRVGSITKTFTATLIMQLVDQKKLQLSTPLSQFFPQVPNASEITIRQMLNHRSGIHNFTADPEYLSYMLQPKTHAEMVAIIAATKPDFAPNEKASYSNSNYVLLGYIVEKLTGKSYAENITTRIAGKAGLKETYVGQKADAGKQEAISFAYDDEWKPLPESDAGILAGAGSIVSTPTDLTRFITALFQGKLVSVQSLNEMKTISDGFGLGLIQVPYEYRKGYGHNGVVDGFLSNLFYFPDDSLAVSVCTNGSTYSINDLVIALLNACYQKPLKIPQFKEFKVNAADLTQYTGTYSSAQLPFSITIKKDSTYLTAQATGQAAFPLEPSAKHEFRFDQAGIVMEFNPQQNQFLLRQGGGNFVFKREY
ncbi:serine hydrolase [Dyadobacter sandarakinus]|uniref:Serine hydrolase n=2 Tax=Dyadobacter sandarakinus TaxID=2747268 RepID=A0ABX7IDV9_9BACT|nr:serine hydrolase [Dyadobacter sandarakinus]